jgi:hypothetical protein
MDIIAMMNIVRYRYRAPLMMWQLAAEKINRYLYG